MSVWNINVDSARGVVKDATTELENLDGIEGRIKASGEAAADAAIEKSINAALDSAYDNFLRPMAVTMVLAGRQLFDGTAGIVNTYAEADLTMSTDADAATDNAMKGILDSMNWSPDYSDAQGTSDVPVLSQPAAPGDPAHYTGGGYRW